MRSQLIFFSVLGLIFITETRLLGQDSYISADKFNYHFINQEWEKAAKEFESRPADSFSQNELEKARLVYRLILKDIEKAEIKEDYKERIALLDGLIKRQFELFTVENNAPGEVNMSNVEAKSDLKANDLQHSVDNRIYELFDLESEPIFDGGVVNLIQFIYGNTKYPDKAVEHGIEGVVVVKAIIEKNGALSNIDVIKSPGYGLDEEVIRVLLDSPKWIPAKRNGLPVRSYINLPVNFKINSSDF
ncbi:energy transducer TonB [Marinigracilibium pacificum]|uniref:Energy transducer TonB n=1 Tax=Marinigracilibium pacificum TaxID=2729599 RepID=A0A848J3P1_9BACT|nr:energy transducer TonB [Marinigracilibium pacificum]NMM48969.1 energy transducer TonB [Marinigracilibium pacificum]